MASYIARQMDAYSFHRLNQLTGCTGGAKRLVAPSFLLSNPELANPDAAGLVISPTNDRNVTKRGVDESLVICVTARTSGPDLRNMLFQLFLALSVGSLRGSRGITRITCGRSFVYHSAGFPFGNTARVFCILGPNTIDISGRMRWIPELP